MTIWKMIHLPATWRVFQAVNDAKMQRKAAGLS